MERQIDHGELAPLGIVVMGVSGSGKTTVGTRLAAMLACPFLEGDDFHDRAAVAKMSHGDPLTDEDRWPWLDRLGATIGATVATSGLVVAACSALRRSYRTRLIAAARVPTRFILLDVPEEELARRLANRPQHYMPPSLLASQLDTLEAPAPDEPVIRLDATPPRGEVCKAALAWLRSGAASPRAVRS